MESLLLKNKVKSSNDIKQKVKYIDIDYDFKREDSSNLSNWTKSRNTICKNHYAILNAYRMWLLSKRYDYIRSADFGGHFGTALNNQFKLSKENAEPLKTYILTTTAEKWPDLEIIDCLVEADIVNRSWNIKIIVKDSSTNMILADELKLEAED